MAPNVHFYHGKPPPSAAGLHASARVGCGRWDTGASSSTLVSGLVFEFKFEFVLDALGVPQCIALHLLHQQYEATTRRTVDASRASITTMPRMLSRSRCRASHLTRPAGRSIDNSHGMGRRKTAAKPETRARPKVAKVFDCPFCNHAQTVECRV